MQTARAASSAQCGLDQSASTENCCINSQTRCREFIDRFRHKYRADNPFVGKVSKRAAKRVKAKPRLPFDADELAMIFGSDIFQIPPHQWEGKQWLAVIALYTGARMEEIGQLRVSDYRVRQGITYFAITTMEFGDDDDGDSPVKSLKTAGSEREIPVHPTLIKLGLTRHVQRMKAIRETRMFPDIRANGGEITAAYSKWFGRFLTKLGITSTQKVFHSFRHTFKDGCRNSGVPREIAEVLMGHVGRTVGDSYGSGHSIEVLSSEIAKVCYGGNSKFIEEHIQKGLEVGNLSDKFRGL